MREGLNFNQKKVKTMSLLDFRNYYAFESFLELSTKDNNTPDVLKVEEQIDLYLENRKKLRKNGLSLLKRILNIIKNYELNTSNFDKLKISILNSDFLCKNHFNTAQYKTIYDLLSNDEKQQMKTIIDEIICNSYYSLFLYNVRQFYLEIEKSIEVIDERINYLNKFYSFI